MQFWPPLAIPASAVPAGTAPELQPDQRNCGRGAIVG